MALVYGQLTDFGLDPINLHQPRVIFTPSANGVLDGRLLSRRPRTSIPDENGGFSVNLAPTTRVRPLVHYDIEIVWLDANSGIASRDFVASKLSVPDEGGSISELLSVPVDNPWLLAFQPNQPSPWPVGLVWVNSETGDITRRTA